MSSCFLFVDEEESNSKVNIDELYQRKQQRDLKQLSIYNKILQRIHKRVQHTARTKRDETFIWFIVPKYIFGEPIFDNGECTGYLVSKLEENGFHVRYIHPNSLFISWANWVPSYVRNQIKKQTGIVLDEKGNVLNKEEVEENVNDDYIGRMGGAGGDQNGKNTQKNAKVFTPIDKYKPTGKFVYSVDMLEQMDKKVGR